MNNYALYVIVRTGNEEKVRHILPERAVEIPVNCDDYNSLYCKFEPPLTRDEISGLAARLSEFEEVSRFTFEDPTSFTSESFSRE